MSFLSVKVVDRMKEKSLDMLITPLPPPPKKKNPNNKTHKNKTETIQYLKAKTGRY